MLKKLLKYDLVWCYKPLVVFYFLTIFLSTIVRIIESLEKSLIVVIIDKICVGAFIAMIVNVLINCFMRNWVNLIRNVYKDESYLTHTLPVTKNEIFNSKVLTGAITLLSSFVVIVLGLSICVLNKDTWLFIKDLLEQSAVYFNSSVYTLVLVLIITIFFEFLFMMMSGLLGIIIGYKSNNLKMAKSVISGFAIYVILSIISVGILYICGIFNSEIMNAFHGMNVSSNAMKNMMLIVIAIYVVYNIVIYFIGKKLLNKGVNVD